MLHVNKNSVRTNFFLKNRDFPLFFKISVKKILRR